MTDPAATAPTPPPAPMTPAKFVGDLFRAIHAMAYPESNIAQIEAAYAEGADLGLPPDFAEKGAVLLEVIRMLPTRQDALSASAIALVAEAVARAEAAEARVAQARAAFAEMVPEAEKVAAFLAEGNAEAKQWGSLVFASEVSRAKLGAAAESARALVQAVRVASGAEAVEPAPGSEARAPG